MTQDVVTGQAQLPAGVEFSPAFVEQVRRRIGYEGLFLAKVLLETAGRFDPVLTSPGRPGTTYNASERIVAALKEAIRETEQGRALAPGPMDRSGRPAIPRCRVRDSFDSYAHAIGQIVLKLSVERRQVTIRVRHCEDSLVEALTQP